MEGLYDLRHSQEFLQCQCFKLLNIFQLDEGHIINSQLYCGRAQEPTKKEEALLQMRCKQRAIENLCPKVLTN